MDEIAARRWICDRLHAGPRPLPAGLTIKAVVAAARAHRIHLVLAAVCERGAPDRAIREALADDVRRAALRAALREDECRRVVRASAEAGVDLVIFKGAALASSVYDHSWTRPFVDVDVLVAEGRVGTMRGVLASIGYEQVAQVDGALITRQAAFVRQGPAGMRHQIDVHWRLFNPEPVGDVFTCEELIARAQPLRALGPGARCPATVDALLIAAVHRAAHHNDADDLIWTWDVDRLARCFSHREWQALAAAARSRRVGALCAASLSRAAACFGTPVPGWVRAALETAGAEPSALFLGGQLGQLDIQLANLVHLRWRDRPRFVAQHLFPSRAYMRRAYGATTVPRLAWSYAARLAAGIPRWLLRAELRGRQ